MTWHFKPKGTTMDVYDHTGALVAENRSFSGSWDNYPDEVKTVMDEALVAEFQSNGMTVYIGQILRHAALDLVEQGTP